MDEIKDSEHFQETLYTEIKSFFDSSPPLKDVDEINRKLEEFIERNYSSSGKHSHLFTLGCIFFFLMQFYFIFSNVV